MMVIARISNLLGKITIFFVICCLIILCVNTAMALDGSGTQEDPWLIQSLDDFNDFAADANYWDDYTRLETDVNLAGLIYTTAVIAPDWDNAFSGVFDGNDHKILNLTIDDGGAGNDGLGLFGNIENGEVRNLGLEGGSVSGDRMVGGLVGSTYEGEGTLSNISNCYSTCDVNGGGVVGGLMGRGMYCSVSNCYSTGDVSGTGDHIGGLVGYILGVVSNCYSTGDVSGDNEIGGLVGSNQASISNCYSTGDVNGVEEVGGLVGVNSDVVRNCYSKGDVSGIQYVGGLLGPNYGYVRDCFWDIETSGEPNMCGINGHSTCDNSYGKTTAQMHQQSTFTDWDFINVWNIGENQTYPYLRKYSPANLNKDHKVDLLDIRILCEQWLEKE
jgi:hypothetical protein